MGIIIWKPKWRVVSNFNYTDQVYQIGTNANLCHLNYLENVKNLEKKRIYTSENACLQPATPPIFVRISFPAKCRLHTDRKVS